MATPPARTEIADTYPNPSNAVARTGFGKLYDYVTGLLGATGAATEARLALGLDGLFASLASASTLNLNTPASTNVDVTGTTTVNAITLTEGRVKIVRFAGILTLTNGASLVLPGAANIVTAAGDYAVFVGRASGVVACVDFTPADGRPRPVTSLGTNGYYKLPSGMVMQWGSSTGTTNGASAISVTFPTSFTSSAYTATVCNGDTGATLSTPGIGSGTLSTTGMTVVFTTGTAGVGTGVNVRVNWVAFGN